MENICPVINCDDGKDCLELYGYSEVCEECLCNTCEKSKCHTHGKRKEEIMV